MRVAYVCADPGVPVFGTKGCSIHVQAIIRALIDEGAEIELFAANVKGDRPDFMQAIAVHQLKQAIKGNPDLHEQECLANNAGLTQLLDDSAPFDLIYERYSLWSYAAMEYANDASIPSVLEVNAPLIEEQADYRVLRDRFAATDVARRVFNAAGIIVAVSQGVADYLDTYREARGHVHVIANGVDARRFPDKPVEPKRMSSDPFVIGFVGSLRPWHGLDVLAESFRLLHERVPSCQLLVVGDGPCASNIHNMLSEHNLLSNAELTGAVKPEAIPELLARMDVAVAPYPEAKKFYFSPLKVYEYMAAGIPVVVSRIGQLESLVENGRNGLTCTPGDAKSFSQALEQIYLDPALAKRLGKAGRRTIREHHTWNKVLKNILLLAEDLSTVKTIALEAS